LIKRRKIQFFKFWPKTILRSAWKRYLTAGHNGHNINAAYLALQVFEKVTTQFVSNCISKQIKKAAKIG
jgi:hypothetical protein